MYLFKILEGEKKDNQVEVIFEEIMDSNFLEQI